MDIDAPIDPKPPPTDEAQEEIILKLLFERGLDGYTMAEVRGKLRELGLDFVKPDSRMIGLRKRRKIVETDAQRIGPKGKLGYVYVHWAFVGQVKSRDRGAEIGFETDTLDRLMHIVERYLIAIDFLEARYRERWAKNYRYVMAAALKELGLRAKKMNLWKEILAQTQPAPSEIEAVCKRYGMSLPPTGKPFPKGAIKRRKNELVIHLHPDQGGDRAAFEAVIQDMDILEAYDRSFDPTAPPKPKKRRRRKPVPKKGEKHGRMKKESTGVVSSTTNAEPGRAPTGTRTSSANASTSPAPPSEVKEHESEERIRTSGDGSAGHG